MPLTRISKKDDPENYGNESGGFDAENTFDFFF